MSPAVPEDPPAASELEPLHAPRYATELHQFSGPSAERSRIARFLAEQESAWQRYRG